MTASAAPAGETPATGTTPAATGTAPATGTTPAATGGAFDWNNAGLQPEHLQYVQTKGYKGPADVVAARIAAEKLIGVPEEFIVRLPKEDTPEAWSPVYDRLGRPKEAAAYELPVPDGDDEAFAKTASPWLHEIGLSKKQGQALATKWNTYQAEQRQQAIAKQQETHAAERNELKKEWGADFDKRYAVAEQAAQKFGMSDAELNGLAAAMGPRAALKFLNNIGSKLGVEPGFVSPEANRPGFAGAVTEIEAQAQIEALKKDQGFIAKMAAGDAEAIGKWRRLHAVGHAKGMVSPFAKAPTA